MKATKALRKISALKKKIWVIQGGQGAGKTYSILQVLINHAHSHPNKEIIIASAELSKMRLTVIKDFVTIMKSFGIFEDRRFLAGTFYRCQNGSFIKFIGLDKEDIGKGLRSDVVFLNEGNKTKFETYRELTSRAKRVIIDYNPNSRFWVHDEIIPRDDCDFLNLTYKDNEYLSQEEVHEIELYYNKGYNEDGTEKNAYWANKWRVYGLGQEGQVEGAIFTDWERGEFDDTLPYIYGLDWGVRHPFALVKVAVDEKNQLIYVQEKVYKTGLGTKDIHALVDKVAGKDKTIVADAADARGIVDLRFAGFNAFKANKKEGILHRIRWMLNYKMIICDSPNIENEVTNYVWLDKNGEVPIDDFNHALDAIGYAFLFLKNFN